MTFRGRPSDDAEDDGVGYRKPPRTTRFAKGRSGNPAGRPRGRHRETPYETVLGQMVTIREDGSERRVTAAEAFLLQLTKRGLEGDSAAARASLAVIEQAGQRHGQSQVETLTIEFVEPGSVTSAMEPLRMAGKLDPYNRTNRPRTLARRSRAGPPPSYPQSRRSADHRGGHPHASQGQVAEMVERTSITCTMGPAQKMAPRAAKLLRVRKL